MRAADPDALLVAKSNAGMPELVDMRAVYRCNPAEMAAQPSVWAGVGASNVASNQARTAGLKGASGSATTAVPTGRAV